MRGRELDVTPKMKEVASAEQAVQQERDRHATGREDRRHSGISCDRSHSCHHQLCPQTFQHVKRVGNTSHCVQLATGWGEAGPEHQANHFCTYIILNRDL